MIRTLFYFVFLLFPNLNFTVPKVSAPLFHVHEIVIGESSGVYDSLNLSELGLSPDAFNLALVGYNKLKAKGLLDNPDVLTIVDFSQTSKNKRMYVIDFEKQKLVHHTLVSHGRNTGDEFAKKFSNVDGSWQSSLGFYITKNTNMGASVGFSLIMEGVEKGFNDKAQQRQIIVHGADYATEDFIRRTGRLGRSFGCPAVPPEEIRPLVKTIQNGSALFIYYPDTEYLRTSPLLNES